MMMLAYIEITWFRWRLLLLTYLFSDYEDIYDTLSRLIFEHLLITPPGAMRYYAMLGLHISMTLICQRGFGFKADNAAVTL